MKCVQSRGGHLGQRRLTNILGLGLAIDLVAQLVVIEETDEWKTNRAQTEFQIVELGAVLGHVVAFLLGKFNQVDIISTAGTRVRLGLVVATASTHEDVNALVKGVRVAQLLGRNAVVVVTACNMSGKA
jgi:hypothetical protein